MNDVVVMVGSSGTEYNGAQGAKTDQNAW